MTAPRPQAIGPDWVDRAAYPFVSRWLELPGGECLHYVDEGAGDPVLFVHGTPTWSFEWRHLIRGLSHAHRCIAVDHLGFGLSDRPRDADYRPEAHAKRLAAFVDRLGLGRYTLVVHDFGGPIGLPLALGARRPARRLVVLNSWMWSLDDDRAMRRAARLAGGPVGRLLYRYFNFSLRTLMPAAYADRDRLTPDIHAQYLAPFDEDAWARTTVLWALARALLGSSAHYDELWRQRERLRELPALVVWGTEDAALPRHMLLRWREALPEATVVELPVGHWPHEEAPDAVLGALQRFLGSAPSVGLPDASSSARAAR